MDVLRHHRLAIALLLGHAALLAAPVLWTALQPLATVNDIAWAGLALEIVLVAALVTRRDRDFWIALVALDVLWLVAHVFAAALQGGLPPLMVVFLALAVARLLIVLSGPVRRLVPQPPPAGTRERGHSADSGTTPSSSA